MTLNVVSDLNNNLHATANAALSINLIVIHEFHYLNKGRRFQVMAWHCLYIQEQNFSVVYEM